MIPRSTRAQDLLRRALELGQSSCLILARSTHEPITPETIVFRALQEVIDIQHKLPDVTWSRNSFRTLWPHFTLSDDERLEAYSQQVWTTLGSPKTVAGKKIAQESVEILAPKCTPSPQDISMMDDVLETFRANLSTRPMVRQVEQVQLAADWKILYDMAEDRKSYKAIARKYSRLVYGYHKRSVTVKTIREIRWLQCHSIARALADFMPDLCKTPIGHENVLRFAEVECI